MTTATISQGELFSPDPIHFDPVQLLSTLTRRLVRVSNGQEARSVVRIAGRAPSAQWFVPTVALLRELVSASPNWDTNGASALSESAANRAIGFLDEHVPDAMPIALIGPMGTGGVHLEWRSGGLTLEVELDAGALPFVSFKDWGSGNEGDFELNDATAAVFRELAERVVV